MWDHNLVEDLEDHLAEVSFSSTSTLLLNRSELAAFMTASIMSIS